MDEMLVLRISDNNCVNLNDARLYSTREIADALEKMSLGNPGMTVSIEASDPIYYVAIGKAIYGSQRAGFSGQRLHVLINDKPLEI